MKKLLIISVVLVVAGLALILISDPVLSQSAGPSGPQGQHTTQAIQQNATSGGGTTSGSGPGSSGAPRSGCTTQSNGAVACGQTSVSTSPLGISDVVTTGIGIALCGVGLFITGVESFSRQVSPYAKPVT